MKNRSLMVILSLLGFSTPIVVSTCSIALFNEFTVTSVSISENGVIGTGSGEIVIHFSSDVDAESAEDAVRVESDGSGEIAFTMEVSGSRVVLRPDEPWKPHERFWLIVEKELRNEHGKEMGEDFYRCFQSTVELLAVSAQLIRPRIQGGIVDEDTTSFEVAFSRDVDRSSVERAFSLYPEVEGYFEWTSARSFTYHLLQSLDKNSLYTLQIGDGAVDGEGYGIRFLLRDFEYYPNQLYPEIERIVSGAEVLFDVQNPLTYTLEGGTYVVEHSGIEKDAVLRIDFSKPALGSSLADGITVSPYVEWRERWIDDRVVEIAFAEPLQLQGLYNLKIRGGIKDLDGLLLLYDYALILKVNGLYSQFLELYAGDLSDIPVNTGDLELRASGIRVDNGVQNVEILEPPQNNYEGPALRIDYDEAQVGDVSNVEVRWEIPLIFENSSYAPAVDPKSLQDSVRLVRITGNKSFSGSILSFNWVSSNECRVLFGEMGADCVYRFSMYGGKKGVIDAQGNYLKEDVDWCFKVILVPGF